MNTCGCHGCGEAGCIDCINGNIIEHVEVCPECNGEGTHLYTFAKDDSDVFECPFCNGKGLMNENELDCYQGYQSGEKDAYKNLRPTCTRDVDFTL